MFYLKTIPIGLEKNFITTDVKITYIYNTKNFEFLDFYLILHSLLYSYIYVFKYPSFKISLTFKKYEFFFLLNFFLGGFYTTLLNTWEVLHNILIKTYLFERLSNLLIHVYLND